VARPLKVLVPLIKDELVAGNEAGLEHYRHAGDLLNEARDSGQVPPGSWSRWLTTNFALSQAREIYLSQIKRAEAEYFERIKRATEIVSEGEAINEAALPPTPTPAAESTAN
jgi:hypothetical protein